MFAEVKVERLLEENVYYDPLFALIGQKKSPEGYDSSTFT